MEVILELFGGVYEGVLAFFQRPLGEVLRDCLDIGLVATLIYWGLVILRGTRAMQMAVGLALVFAGYLAAKRFDLITIWTMLDSLVTYFVLVVVIIFQADIRRGLMRVGRGPLFRGQRTARETAVIEEVVKAASSLAAGEGRTARSMYGGGRDGEARYRFRVKGSSMASMMLESRGLEDQAVAESCQHWVRALSGLEEGEHAVMSRSGARDGRPRRSSPKGAEWVLKPERGGCAAMSRSGGV